ncbi:uncharacterized protein A4U43_C01F12500 [Asparagus officinalis]|uniref:Uncharacterized protein n=1 Tax=Asparagus officinalis TaxID=4686 RepID=A0A5P1FPD9_ASPOF|nr:uncharacterized protein A4U43_C01F12500 [Asparagus officinalis]
MDIDLNSAALASGRREAKNLRPPTRSEITQDREHRTPSKSASRSAAQGLFKKGGRRSASSVGPDRRHQRLPPGGKTLYLLQPVCLKRPDRLLEPGPLFSVGPRRSSVNCAAAVEEREERRRRRRTGRGRRRVIGGRRRGLRRWALTS